MLKLIKGNEMKIPSNKTEEFMIKIKELLDEYECALVVPSETSKISICMDGNNVVFDEEITGVCIEHRWFITE